MGVKYVCATGVRPENLTVKSYASFTQTESRLPAHGITFFGNL